MHALCKQHTFLHVRYITDTGCSWKVITPNNTWEQSINISY